MSCSRTCSKELATARFFFQGSGLFGIHFFLSRTFEQNCYKKYLFQVTDESACFFFFQFVICKIFLRKYNTPSLNWICIRHSISESGQKFRILAGPDLSNTINRGLSTIQFSNHTIFTGYLLRYVQVATDVYLFVSYQKFFYPLSARADPPVFFFFLSYFLILSLLFCSAFRQAKVAPISSERNWVPPVRYRYPLQRYHPNIDR
jgi:hypothetical protein